MRPDITSTGASSPRPAVEIAVFYAALLLGVVSILASPAIPEGLIRGPLCLLAAWGMRRERAWSAYGLALLAAVSAGTTMANGMFGPQQPTSLAAATLKLSALVAVGVVVLFFLAGRSIERRVGRRGRAWPWIAASMLIGGFLLLFGLYSTPTGSMENTLLAGDHIAVWRSHGKVPARGEMVVHIYPVNRTDIFVKRVVGLPGDRVRIRNKQLFVNGAAVAEPYAIHKTEYLDNYRDNFPSEANVPLYPAGREMLDKHVVNGEVVVPAGRYFVLGDNRDASLDSRYWGFIELSDIIGTPKFVYYSVEQNAEGDVNGSPLLHLRWGRIFHRVS
jgi:signal peptidase I